MKPPKVRQRLIFWTLLLALWSTGGVQAYLLEGTHAFVADVEETSAHSADFYSIPPSLERATGKPSVILSLDTSAAMLAPAYLAKDADWSGSVQRDFAPERLYEGYFDAQARYQYDSQQQLFVAHESGAWQGNFLNWLSMRRIDLARQALVGGKVRDRAGEQLASQQVWVLEGERPIGGLGLYQKADQRSSAYSPVPDGTTIQVTEGQIEFVVASKTESQSSASAKQSGESDTGNEDSTHRFSIAVAVLQEPQGIVQAQSAHINFGLSVFNFDHRLHSLSELVSANQVDGQTLHPCYFITDATRRTRRFAEAAAQPSESSVAAVASYQGEPRDYLCVPTGVHAPNARIVQVIEEHPLIAGDAPLAEALVDIGRYVRQVAAQYPNTLSSNVATAHRHANSPREVFGVGSDWDPFFDVTQQQSMECKKVFVLHVGAGEISGDFNSSSSHPGVGEELTDISGESRATNEALDNVALALRANDCRSDLANHQEVISYYVFLGADSDSAAARRLREAAARGGFLDLNHNLGPDPLRPAAADFNAYARLNSTPGISNPTLCPALEWDQNSDCEPDAFLQASEIRGLQARLFSAVSDIKARVASGGGASVMANSAGGDGVLYQASFSPSRTQGGDTVKWTGDLSALMIDADGLLRSDDNHDAKLDDYSVDRIVDTCYDAQAHRVRVALSTDSTARPSRTDAERCRAGAPYQHSLSEVGYLWSGAEFLASLGGVGQRAYAAASPGRYIFTDADNDGDTEAFIPETFETGFGRLDADGPTLAAKIVNFVRGQDQPGMRSRQLNGRTQRLGDIIYSRPTAVGKPAENLHLLYDDATYLDFYRQYRNRRTMVYVGANDGMLHAFNAGWFDQAGGKFAGSVSGTNPWVLGQEVWAYVPYNLLPHLRELTRPEYGLRDGHHLSYVDQSSYVFDARIFNSVQGQPDRTDSNGQTITTHPNGWGTVMVVGFRSGGGEVTVYPEPNEFVAKETMRPAWLIFDITDPEQPPVLLKEFSHPQLGMSFSEPTTLTLRNTSGSREDGTDLDWFLMFGSGPSATPDGIREMKSSQSARLGLFNLRTLQLQSGFGSGGIFELEEADAFVGDILAADFDLDVSTDALYFGTTQALDTSGDDGVVDAWQGKLYRMRIQPGSSAATHQWKAEVMLDPQRPILSRPALSFDGLLNRWLHIGTGRFLTAADSLDGTTQSLFGVKEPRGSDGVFAMDSFSSAVSEIRLDALVDVSRARVEEFSGDLAGSVAGSETVAELEQRLMQFQSSDTQAPGWQKRLTPGERALGAPLVIGSVLSQSTYLPQLVACSFMGDAFLYAVRFTTGTPWSHHVFFDPDTTSNNNDVLDSVRIGSAPSFTPAVQFGARRAEGEATLINVNADLSITTTQEQNLQELDSRETSWREM